jgi:hypothetical protein
LFFNDLIVKNYSSTNLYDYHYPLEVSPDFLLNGTIQEKAKKNIQDSELSLQFEKIEKLFDDKKHFLKCGFVFYLVYGHGKHFRAIVACVYPSDRVEKGEPF